MTVRNSVLECTSGNTLGKNLLVAQGCRYTLEVTETCTLPCEFKSHLVKNNLGHIKLEVLICQLFSYHLLFTNLLRVAEITRYINGVKGKVDVTFAVAATTGVDTGVMLEGLVGKVIRQRVCIRCKILLLLILRAQSILCNRVNVVYLYCITFCVCNKTFVILWSQQQCVEFLGTNLEHCHRKIHSTLITLAFHTHKSLGKTQIRLLGTMKHNVGNRD